tara:strand:+ start:13033 stop:13248 length:216 start_codon:yes stop_codon:yes gene_type:complete
MELSIAVVGILGAMGGVIKASNCKKVSVCKLIECEKDIPIETVETVSEAKGSSDFDIALKKNSSNSNEAKV